jgi:hypothetical protein
MSLDLLVDIALWELYFGLEQRDVNELGDVR